MMAIALGIGTWGAPAEAAALWTNADGSVLTAEEAGAIFEACQATSRRADADGAPTVVWALVQSCVEAQGVVLAGDAREVGHWTANRWIGASCPSQEARTDQAAVAHGCRMEAVTLDRDGRPGVDEAAVSICMAAFDLEEAAPRAFTAWLETCDAEEASP